MKHHLTKLLDAPALAIAMLVDAALVGISLFIVAPGPLEKIGMVLLAVVVVLFSVRGWVIGGKVGRGLWICFALASFFLDLSFALVSTDVQAVAVHDAELDRLTAKVDALQAQYDAAGTRATMDQLDEQIKAAEAKAEKYRQARQDRLGRVESGQSKEITSAALSTAIYDAASSGNPGRITWLIVFALIFAGLQLTMITAATSAFAKKPDEQLQKKPEVAISRKRFAVDDISRWVSVEWTYLRNGRGTAPVTRASFERVAKGRFDMALWDQLMARAIDAGLIVNGKIVEPDQRKAVEVLS
jgi:hypothetical protein